MLFLVEYSSHDSVYMHPVMDLVLTKVFPVADWARLNSDASDFSNILFLFLHFDILPRLYFKRVYKCKVYTDICTFNYKIVFVGVFVRFTFNYYLVQRFCCRL